MPECHIIDLSHHNVVTDFARVKAAGVVGVIHKATEGKTFTDTTYKARESAARKAGLAWGSYHFLKHGDAGAQMQNYLSFAEPEPGARVCIDYEDAACKLDDLDEAIAAIRADDATLQIAIYGGALLKEQIGNANYPDFGACALWISQWNNSGPSWPDETWPVWSLWQYTDRGVVSGIQGDVDCNQFNGSKRQCLAWMGPATVQPKPVYDYVAALTVPKGATYAVTVNGVTRADGKA
jgi:lysozyme